MRRLGGWVLAGWLVLVAIGLVVAMLRGPSQADEDEPPEPPSSEELKRLTSSATFPVYWLGTSQEDRKLTRAASHHGRVVSLSYGEPSCSPGSGCSYDLDVVTSTDRATETEDRDTGERFGICWRRVGRALALGCREGEPEEIEVFTGSVVVYIHLETGSAHRVARSLRPMTTNAQRGLEPPEPLSCKEMRRISSRLRKRLPEELRRGCPRD